MQFLSDVYVTCEVCHGKRYNSETLAVHYHHLSVSDVLDLTIDQAINLFKNHAPLLKKLATLQAVGLGYIKLGQPAPTLSGGEAQRVKLAKELSIGMSGHTVYLLDEPTTGLHFEDVKNLLIVLKTLVDQNNTVIVIEHNLDVIKNADWVIDLGPDGGESGGYVVVSGNPDTVAQNSHSYTGHYLKQIIS
jgi:excinuclease ABC subunit A